MAESAPTLLQQGRRLNFLKKLQSLCGVVPLAFFFCFHMVANYTLTWSIPAYDAFSSFLQTMPYKDLLEVAIIFAPLVFHAAIGIYLVFTSSANVVAYGYMRNWRYLFQRITGIIALAFLLWHVIGLKWAVSLMPAGGSTFAILQSVVANPIGLAAFAIGVYSCLYHLVNGLWTFCITWGITLTPRSQQISSYICLALFIVGALFIGQIIVDMVIG